MKGQAPRGQKFVLVGLGFCWGITGEGPESTGSKRRVNLERLWVEKAWEKLGRRKSCDVATRILVV